MDNKDSIVNIADIGLLDAKKLRLTESAGGYADLEYDSKKYSRIRISRALPSKMPDKFIFFSTGEGEEIGMIEDLSGLDDDSLTVLRAELDKIYFSPEITKILSVKDSMGFMYFDTETVQGRRSFAVRDVLRNIRFINGNYVQITDADGNRYHIRDVSELDAASVKKLNSFML